jgi:imidazolonepropionase-like amidohydrolase
MKQLSVVSLSVAMVCMTLATLPAQSTGGVKAFTGARVVDGTDRAPIDNATIVVRGGKIVGVGPAASVTIPAGAERASLTGKTVIPGLVNAHGHVGNTVGLEQGHYSAENVQKDLRTYAAYGVTTVYSLGDDQAAGIAARDAQRTPSLDRARLFVAGPVLAPKTVEEARKLVDEDAAMKVDIVKIRVDDNLGTTAKMAPEIYRAVIDQAHKKGLRVAVHLFYLDDAKAVLDAGADFIAHSVRDADVDDAFVAMLKRRDVCYCPTLMREVSTFVYESTPAWFTDPLFLKHADQKALDALKQPARQVLASATRDAARCMKLDTEVGTLEASRWADFVVLDADPLVAIANVKKINAVYVAGNRVAE